MPWLDRDPVPHSNHQVGTQASSASALPTCLISLLALRPRQTEPIPMLSSHLPAQLCGANAAVPSQSAGDDLLSALRKEEALRAPLDLKCGPRCNYALLPLSLPGRGEDTVGLVLKL